MPVGGGASRFGTTASADASNYEMRVDDDELGCADDPNDTGVFVFRGIESGPAALERAALLLRNVMEEARLVQQRSSTELDACPSLLGATSRVSEEGKTQGVEGAAV